MRGREPINKNMNRCLAILVSSSGNTRLGGSCLALESDFDADCGAGAVSGRVGECVGEVFEGVPVLLELGVIVGVSLVVFALGRPLSDRNERLVSDSSATGGEFPVCAFFGGSPCSLNCAGSGLDCEGVSETATSPTCFCDDCSTPLVSILGLSLNQKAQPDEFVG